MYTVTARNVNEAYTLGARLIRHYGEREHSRNGPVYVVPHPVTTHYAYPNERVLFDKERDCNPYFHFMEAMWMLAGRNDVRWISQFNSTFGQFSDDEQTFHGAYGYRWRRAFGLDQLTAAVAELRKDTSSRRAVIGIYDPARDLGSDSKDVPCNLAINLQIRRGKLCMVVFNRSNDIIWGCYGSNAVHFSMLQEYLAGWLGVDLGWYEQVSGNYHAYVETWEKHDLEGACYKSIACPYELGKVKPFPMFNTGDTIAMWDRDLRQFIHEGQEIDPVSDYQTAFFGYVASPMLDSWKAYKARNKEIAIAAMEECRATDWRKACCDWLERRKWEVAA